MSNYSFTDHQGDGVTTSFPFSFVGQGKGYIRESDIYVYVNGSESLFVLSGENQITFAAAPSFGSLIRIRRIMPKSEPFANFSRGNAFTQDLLNKSFLQTLYAYHEFLDGFLPEFPFDLKGALNAEGITLSGELDMGGNKVVNLGNGEFPTDAMPLGQGLAIQASAISSAESAAADAVRAEEAAAIAIQYPEGLFAAALAAEDSVVPVAGILASQLGIKYKSNVSILDYKHLVVGGDWLPAIQAAIDSGAVRIHVPAGVWQVNGTINLCERATTGAGLTLYGDGVAYDDGAVGTASVIKSNPGNSNWIAEIVGSQFVCIEDIKFTSSGLNAAVGGLMYARSVLAVYAQNNSLRRVIVKLESRGNSTIALATNCAEQFVCDECWFEADIPYVSTLNNEYNLDPQYATVSNVIYSNTAFTFRLSTFTPLTSAAAVLIGVGTAYFDTCVFIPKAGNTHPYGIELRSSVAAYADCQNIEITGQIESFDSAVYLSGNTKDITLNFSTSEVSGSHITLYSDTTHFNPNWKTNPLNDFGVNVVDTTGGTAVVKGGIIEIAESLRFSSANTRLIGTTINGGSINMDDSSYFSVASNSYYQVNWFASSLLYKISLNPDLIATGTSVSYILAAGGVKLRDNIQVHWPYPSSGCIATASPESADNIRLVIANFSGFNQTLALGDWVFTVNRAAGV